MAKALMGYASLGFALCKSVRLFRLLVTSLILHPVVVSTHAVAVAMHLAQQHRSLLSVLLLLLLLPCRLTCPTQLAAVNLLMEMSRPALTSQHSVLNYCCVLYCTVLHAMQLAAVNLLMEMSRPEEFWQPFFKTLPQPGEVVSPLVSMPAEYLPLLQSEPLVRTDSRGHWGLLAASCMHASVWEGFCV
jgi:hypothetical protein